jgi:predicted nucleotidyltransferase
LAGTRLRSIIERQSRTLDVVDRCNAASLSIFFVWAYLATAERQERGHVRIDPNGSIAGRPALEIRKLLSRGRGGLWTIGFVAEQLATSEAEAQRIIDELSLAGYIERESMFPDRTHWVNSLDGNALAMATSAKPVHRATAEKKVAEFLDRVHRVNDDTHFLYRVTRVVAFGSYLTDRERINDVDLGVELRPKFQDRDEQMEHEKARARQAQIEGRRFRSFIDMLLWPKRETFLFLKSRSRTISLHDTEDPILLQVECRTIFPEDGSADEGSVARTAPNQRMEP